MRTKRVYCSVLLFLAYNSHGSLCAQLLEKQIDSLILTEFVDSDGLGGVFMVAKAGQVIYENGFGKANLPTQLTRDMLLIPRFQFRCPSCQ
ncbi:hypothetical protein [Olivibacter sitiensis]|uniref:hypothetical protein n=1 Tax=Olivibacter sitiensis TaxID=376470 RepID=UPI0012FB9E34|nr:hypothetical protein [Olivibacter sitiensis]